MQIKLYVHLLHSLDVPNYEGLKIEYLPSLAYISQDKKIKVYSGITDIKKIKQIFQYTSE